LSTSKPKRRCLTIKECTLHPGFQPTPGRTLKQTAGLAVRASFAWRRSLHGRNLRTYIAPCDCNIQGCQTSQVLESTICPAEIVQIQPCEKDVTSFYVLGLKSSLFVSYVYGDFLLALWKLQPLVFGYHNLLSASGTFWSGGTLTFIDVAFRKNVDAATLWV
jgi:hypothetical protein